MCVFRVRFVAFPHIIMMRVSWFRRVCLDMKVELGEGTREPRVVAEDRQIHGYGGASVARSEAPSSNRAVAVVQQQGASSSVGFANGTADGADGADRAAGLRNGLRATVGSGEGATAVTVQHGGTIVADTSTLVGSGKYRQQVGEKLGEHGVFLFFFAFARA